MEDPGTLNQGPPTGTALVLRCGYCYRSSPPGGSVPPQIRHIRQQMASVPGCLPAGGGEQRCRPGATHLFSVEQKNCTHGLTLLSGAGAGTWPRRSKSAAVSAAPSLGREDRREPTPEVPSSPEGPHAHPTQLSFRSMKRRTPFYPCEAEAGSRASRVSSLIV